MESFTKVPTQPKFPTLEEQVLDRWKRERTFERSVSERQGSPEFIFYDGPPFPTGSPHHGTIFVSILKDVVPRYKTMRGYYVPRQWGWDCHGLPIETQAERNLGIKQKSEIESTVGVAAFNAECRRIVSSYNEAWRTYIDRIGRWVDMETPYRTLDLEFMESVLWAFAESYRRGLIYRDYRVTPYCYRCETPLSISDTRLDDSTRPKQDRAITVRFALQGLDNAVDALAWTTTPWTLPSNLALTVNSDIRYAVVEDGAGGRVLLAEDCIAQFSAELGKSPTIVERYTGAQLLAKKLRYEPIFPFFADHPHAFRLIGGDFVSTGEGTGIVHTAPAFGEDDYWVSRRHEIRPVCPVDDQGNFLSQVTDWAGRNVHEANSDIIRTLKARGRIFKDSTIEHNYPHCWRCRTPLIYRTVEAWYYAVEKLKERLIEQNQKIEWHPDTVKEGRFGKWLEGARDWNISRNRYWATPIPVWSCGSCKREEVCGSVAEIAERAQRPITDLHKEVLDGVRYPCTCGGEMRRTPEVLDGWFESGSMPYGQFHYPFERVEHFKQHFPADFIVEYTGQIRGWFYVLHVLSTGLFERPAFKHCLVHGTLLAEDGKKISKSLKNYTDPLELVDRYGADALRAYLLSSQAVQMADLNFSDAGVEGMVKGLILPYWNALTFFTTYAETDGLTPADVHELAPASARSELERYILSETELLTRAVTEKLESYAIHEAMRLFAPFLDTLNNWFIRRGRSVVWGESMSAEKRSFYAVLHRVLGRFTQLLAPLCPFITETGWQYLGNPESIHLSAWPEVDESLINEQLSAEIGIVRSAVTAGLALRGRHKLRVRQPLARCRIFTPAQTMLERHRSAVMEELNVKALEFVPNVEALGTQVIQGDARKIGKRLGKATQGIFTALKSGAFSLKPDGTLAVLEFNLLPDEFALGFVGREGAATESFGEGVLELDTTLTPALICEGSARDLVRHIQEARKSAQLDISDRIQLAVTGLDDVTGSFGEFIRRETLALELTSSLSDPLYTSTTQIEGRTVTIALRKA